MILCVNDFFGISGKQKFSNMILNGFQVMVKHDITAELLKCKLELFLKPLFFDSVKSLVTILSSPRLSPGGQHE